MSLLTRGIAPHQSLLSSLHRVVDVAVICGVLAIALRATPAATTHDWLVISASTILIHHLVAELSGLYRSWRGTRLRRELACIFVSWGYTAALLLGIGLVGNFNGQFTYASKLCFLIATPLVMIASRIVLRKIQQALRAHGLNTRRYAVCGVNELGIQLARNVERAPELGLRLAGFFDDRPGERTAPIPNSLGAQVGDLEGLIEAARCGEVDIIYITFPMRAEDRIRDVLAKLGDTTASVYIVPDFFVFELLHARWTNVNGLPAVSVFENPLYGVDGLLKRAADLVFGSLFLALAALPMLIIAAAIKLTGPGPVFFRQKRYGLDGREIRVWKFRTMTVCENGAEIRQAGKDDDRITPIGRLLRETSLDEIPQLFNVLSGSMSLVGPRPHATAHNEQYRSLIDGYMLRHKVKPGITGLAQIRGFRGETETLDKMAGRVRCDHEYIRHWSLWMDLRILVKTFLVVWRQGNAY